MNTKKIFLSLGILLGIGVLFGLTTFFLPNELSSKIANAKGDFARAERLFPQWSLLAKNNSWGKLYAEGKYQDLEPLLQEVEKTTCSLEAEIIPRSCANIFYLHGLTQYQLGKDLEQEKKKTFFEEAIQNFQKVMMMTRDDSQEYLWSKENIEFLLEHLEREEREENGSEEKEEEKEGQKQKTSSGGKDPNSKDESSEEKQGEQDSEKAEDSSVKNSESQQQEGESGDKNPNTDDKSSEEKQQQKDSSGENSEQESDSLLPEEMQNALEKAQEDLDDQGQQGFYRSASAAEKNSLQNNDPFDMMRNDPFFQDFFGNDPFFQNALGEKNFQNTIPNPDEKDW